MEEFDVRVSGEDGIRVVTVTGELDVATAPDLEKVLLEAEAETDHLVVDLTPTTFLDSTGLKILVRSAKRVAAFTFVCPPDNHPVVRVLSFAGVADAYPLVGTVAEAG